MHFFSDHRGSVAIAFALALTMLLGAVGLALDYGRAYSAKEDIQSELDAAVLAGARVLQQTHSTSEAQSAAYAFIGTSKKQVTSFSSSITFVSTHFTVNGSEGTVVGKVTATIETPFMKVLGLGHQTIAVQSASQVGDGIQVEVALMIDISDSMADSFSASASHPRIQSLKDSAHEMIDTVLGSDQGQARMSIVPFSRTLNAGTYADDVAGSTGQTCVEEFTNSSDQQILSDSPPRSGNLLKTADCDGISDDEAIVPLTSNKADLHNTIDAVKPHGPTAGTLATAWTWYTLSPNWRSVFGSRAGAAYASGSGKPSVRKIAVLITDGAFNTWKGIKYDSTTLNVSQREVARMRDQINQAARDLCQSMKNKQIEIFTIGIDIDPGAPYANDTLTLCASGADHYFQTNSADQFRAALKEIAIQAVPLHVSN